MLLGWGGGTTAPNQGRSDATVMTPCVERSSLATSVAAVLMPPGPTPITTIPLLCQYWENDG